jgi:hypothetical protein
VTTVALEELTGKLRQAVASLGRDTSISQVLTLLPGEAAAQIIDDTVDLPWPELTAAAADESLSAFVVATLACRPDVSKAFLLACAQRGFDLLPRTADLPRPVLRAVIAGARAGGDTAPVAALRVIKDHVRAGRLEPGDLVEELRRPSFLGELANISFAEVRGTSREAAVRDFWERTHQVVVTELEQRLGDHDAAWALFHRLRPDFPGTLLELLDVAAGSGT